MKQRMQLQSSSGTPIYFIRQFLQGALDADRARELHGSDAGDRRLAATEGLWLVELLDVSPLNQAQRRQIAARLIQQGQAREIPVKYNAPSFGRPEAA